MDGVLPLPFNLVLKHRHRTREQEASAMIAARAIGIPAPRFLQFGDHGATGSILMTRIPGKPLDEAYESLSPNEMQTITQELVECINLMRSFRSPWGARVCSDSGGPVSGSRIPGGRLEPCHDEYAFHSAYLEYADPQFWYYETPSFENNLTTANTLLTMTHTMVFTHGDLMPHNIMIHDGHISGIIDWECAGWFPDYWEYTSMLNRSPPNGWWSKVVTSLPGYKYERELESFHALWEFAQDSFSW